MTPFRKGVRLIPFLFLVEVFCDVVTGVLEISSNGEHGAKGQNGGDGVPGVRPPPVADILVGVRGGLCLFRAATFNVIDGFFVRNGCKLCI